MVAATNMIFFLSDNHTRDLLGAAGHPVVQTPTLDRIAARGVRFANAYATSPLCCPSRAALACGRFPHQTGYWDNALAYDGTVPTWHGRIRDQGHTVVAVGKLHFQSGENDNGFSDEIVPMHIIEGKGALVGLLRATEDGVPPRKGPRAMYEKSGVGEADYQRYDETVTTNAIAWLREHGAKQDKPWILLVSYASPHPPFAIPKRLYDLYPPDRMPLPVQFSAQDRPDHPAVAHIRRVDGFEEPFDEEFARRTVVGYCGLVTHLDEHIGRVMAEADGLGLLDKTRILYTSDHGEAAGNHGLCGKSVLYEHSIGVPLLMAGPEVPNARVIDQIAMHVDLFPTIVEAMGCGLAEEDEDLPGRSLWPAVNGDEEHRIAFAEFHAQSSKTGSYLLRDGSDKLIYHVNMPNQLFDLAADPTETRDRILAGEGSETEAALEAKLRALLDPEAVDARAKAEQLAHTDRHGGVDAVRERGSITYTPVPGDPLDMEKVG
jgi:choline-sulfatase